MREQPWGDVTVFVCDRCGYSHGDRATVEAHERVCPATAPVFVLAPSAWEEIPFASERARELAQKLPPYAVAMLRTREPSGEGGYTAQDVRELASELGVALEDTEVLPPPSEEA